VVVRLFPRELKKFRYLKTTWQDRALEVFCSLILYHYEHLKKLCLYEHLRFGCKQVNDEERAECCCGWARQNARSVRVCLELFCSTFFFQEKKVENINLKDW
jgi:hypothetical protein